MRGLQQRSDRFCAHPLARRIGEGMTRCLWRIALAWAALAWSVPIPAATISESFAGNPLTNGWRIHGEASLFRWNATNQNLEVTWDSSRTNSYFWLPLGNILSRADDFTISFDLRLKDISIGTSSNKQYTFQIAAGLLRFTNAIATNFFRGAGQNNSYSPRNLVEFSYFPDSGFEATFAPTIVTTNRLIVFNSNNHPLEMEPGALYQVATTFTSSNRTLKTAVLKNGAPYGLPPSNTLQETVLSTSHDFRVDTLAVMSYSDAIQVGPREWWGSVLAHGTIDNLSVTMPEPPVRHFTGGRSNGTWHAQFLTRTNWTYTLEQSADLATWQAASAPLPGTGGTVSLSDTNPLGMARFYRVQADKP